MPAKDTLIGDIYCIFNSVIDGMYYDTDTLFTV